ncbi:hypothetical protein SPBR_01692 [Sporothrix brasiliensis 5110]|uniref:Uncharacterized protein n=1 Tax=Sporothrix brasiliensis 5110 TaxID=1398154 RepID=A0A0C2IRT2_9PEZI|nr:uncharacterized protein SPBR_01692 [Sporothrix brasiliensis 5110]KIH91741.1 hypothetical protein SPBR_01692 [Sporothrix brasiliensis 5110]
MVVAAVAVAVGKVVGGPEGNVVVVHEGGNVGVFGVHERCVVVVVKAVGAAAAGVGVDARGAARSSSTTDTALFGQSLLRGNLGGAGHGAAEDKEADADANQAKDGHADVVEGLGAGGHAVAVLGQFGEPAADEDVDQQLGARNGRADGKVERGDAGDGGQEAVAQAVGQRAEADRGQHPDAVAAQDLAEGDKAVVGADETVDVAAEHGAAGNKGGEAADDIGGGGNGPAPGEAIHQTGEGAGGAVADDGREARDEHEQPHQDPAAGQVVPALGNGAQSGKDAVAVDEHENAQSKADGAKGHEQDAVQGGEADVKGESVRQSEAAVDDAVAMAPRMPAGPRRRRAPALLEKEARPVFLRLLLPSPPPPPPPLPKELRPLDREALLRCELARLMEKCECCGLLWPVLPPVLSGRRAHAGCGEGEVEADLGEPEALMFMLAGTRGDGEREPLGEGASGTAAAAETGAW